MYKAIFYIFLIFVSSSSFAQTEEKIESETAYFLTFNVKYGLKKVGHVQSLFMNVGSFSDHPYYGKVKNIENKKIALGILGNTQIFTNEIDLLFFLYSEGWDIVNVQEVTEMSTSYKQYLMKYKIKK